MITLAEPRDLESDVADDKTAAPAAKAERGEGAAMKSARTQAQLVKPAATQPEPVRRKTALWPLALAAILAIIVLLLWWLAR